MRVYIGARSGVYRLDGGELTALEIEGVRFWAIHAWRNERGEELLVQRAEQIERRPTRQQAVKLEQIRLCALQRLHQLIDRSIDILVMNMGASIISNPVLLDERYSGASHVYTKRYRIAFENHRCNCPSAGFIGTTEQRRQTARRHLAVVVNEHHVFGGHAGHADVAGLIG